MDEEERRVEPIDVLWTADRHREYVAPRVVMAPGRRCGCGTRLSVYNEDDSCWSCQHG